MSQVKVGGETPAYCTSCRAMRHHVVVAMVGQTPARVECRSCHKQHNYKAAPPGTRAETRSRKTQPGEAAAARKPRARAAPAPDPEPCEHPLDALLKVRSRSEARTYSPFDRYEVGEFLDHPSFGLGAVAAAPAPDKIEVIFRESSKLLLHGRPAREAAAPPRLQPPPRREEGPPRAPSDAPPKPAR